MTAENTVLQEMADATEARAAAAGRPVTYQVLVEQGWRWASIAGGTPHLVPPYGDAAACHRAVERTRRQVVTTGIAERGCVDCKRRAGFEA